LSAELVEAIVVVVERASTVDELVDVHNNARPTHR